MSKNYDFVWDRTPDRIRKGHFLPVGGKQSGPFSGMDSEDRFKESLKTQPSDWFYRSHYVDYTLNRYGYRTAEFNTVDWANSTVVFGCSNVYGVGLRECDTLSSQLSKLINMPVINMGMGGSSIEYSLYNSIILNDAYPTPKAVVQIYSALSRTTYYNNKNVVHHGTWDMKMNDYMDLYSSDPAHGTVHGLMAQMISKQLWKDKTKYYEASFFGDTCTNLQIPECPFIDKARDLAHPGPVSLGLLAIQIKDSLAL